MSDKKKGEVLDKKPIEGAPKKDPRGRDLVAERVTTKDGEAPEKHLVRAQVPGVLVEADDRDGAGLARALSTLAGMTDG